MNLFSFNPGRIDPTNAVWVSTRKPLVAEWVTPSGAKLFTVDVHMSSKGGGSTSTQGDNRPPINSPVATRTGQIEVTSVCLMYMYVVAILMMFAGFHPDDLGCQPRRQYHRGW